MAKIVRSLLLFSRQRKPERRAVDLRPVIQQVLTTSTCPRSTAPTSIAPTWRSGTSCRALPVHHRDTASTEAWRFLQDTRVPVLEKPFTPQALLRGVEQVSA